jgi:hypothetical protein
MAKSKKYDFRVVPGKSGWTAEIIRRVTARESAVSKSQDGFATEAEAQVWGETTLKSFLESLTERNKRRALKRDSGTSK